MVGGWWFVVSGLRFERCWFRGPTNNVFAGLRGKRPGKAFFDGQKGKSPEPANDA